MRILGIIGTHRRHLYFFDQLRRAHPLAGLVLQQREETIPSPPEATSAHDRANFVRHFQRRWDCEVAYYGDPSVGGIPTHRTTPADLNDAATEDFVRKIAPDVVIIFGTHLIKGPLLSSLPEHTLNLHLGLSPRYRGAATLFWPFYFLEPNHAGSTLHYIVGEPDAGDMVHQVVPTLERDDGIHDVGCKTVIASVVEVGEVLTRLGEKGTLVRRVQRGTGKNFLHADFRPAHLRVVYDLCGDEVVRMYLDGELRARDPRLIRQF